MPLLGVWTVSSRPSKTAAGAKPCGRGRSCKRRKEKQLKTMETLPRGGEESSSGLSPHWLLHQPWPSLFFFFLVRPTACCTRWPIRRKMISPYRWCKTLGESKGMFRTARLDKCVARVARQTDDSWTQRWMWTLTLVRRTRSLEFQSYAQRVLVRCQREKFIHVCDVVILKKRFCIEMWRANWTNA